MLAVNHEEALIFAHSHKEDSNLARCYIELSEVAAQTEPPATNSAMDAIAELIKKYSIPWPHAVLDPRKVVDDLQAIVRQQHQ